MTKKITHEALYTMILSLFIMGLCILIPHSSYASNTVEPIGCTLDLIVNELQGKVGTAIAIIAVIMLNIRYFYGKINWGKELTLYIGVAIIFGAANIINYLALIPITDYDQCIATAEGYIDGGLTGAPGLPTNTGYVPPPGPGQNGYIRPLDGIPVNTASDISDTLAVPNNSDLTNGSPFDGLSSSVEHINGEDVVPITIETIPNNPTIQQVNNLMTEDQHTLSMLQMSNPGQTSSNLSDANRLMHDINILNQIQTPGNPDPYPGY